MFEFTKLCNAFEKLSPVERGALLAEKSVKVLAKLKLLGAEDGDPTFALASFILGSVVADGKVDEREYLLMYPALIKVFGDGFDFDSVKAAIEADAEGKKAVKAYTEELIKDLSAADKSLVEDVVVVCLCVVAMDGRVSLREKNYIKRLCKA